MKNRYILPVLIILFFSNCEKVIDLEVPSIEPKLIIDASFEVMFDQTPIISNNSVKLRLSADYFEDTIPIVTNATVFLTNLSNNTVIPFSDVNTDGDYEPSGLFIPLDEVEYELTVIYNNETFKGKATKVKTSKLITVEQGEKTLFSGDEIELKISFQDNQAQENYYLFNIDIFNYLTIEDRYFDGSMNFPKAFRLNYLELQKNILHILEY
jgi:hypothetical protein